MNDAARGALIMDLIRRLPLCSYDEARVIDLQLSRLEMGRVQYGPLDLGKHRNWMREAAHERIDEQFYRACAYLLYEDDLEIRAVGSQTSGRVPVSTQPSSVPESESDTARPAQPMNRPPLPRDVIVSDVVHADARGPRVRTVTIPPAAAGRTFVSFDDIDEKFDGGDE